MGIGAIVVVGGAALLDVHPQRAARSGTLTAIAFNVGIAIAALGTATLAPRPPATPCSCPIPPTRSSPWSCSSSSW
ncbi:hypothetical protein ACIQM3_07350 [Streptomyces sp. NPDC091271]|uniref:hypothetical protein n=1 Tax=Streptomyces sp. NPDC091271 TaxID=3365980 RepID=UPI00382A8C24